MKKLPIKQLIFLILMIFCIPFTVFFIGYNIYTINVVDDRIAENTKSKIVYYQQSLESIFHRIELFMVNTVANDENFRQLEFKLSELDAHLNTYEVLQKYRNMIAITPVLRGMYIYTVKNNLYRKVYTDNFPLPKKEAIEDFLKKKILLDHPDFHEWNVEKIGDRYYLFRILGVNGTYCISLVDFDLLQKSEELLSVSDEHLFYAKRNLQPVTEETVLAEKKIDLGSIRPDRKFTVLHGDRPYFLVTSYSDYLHLYLVSCTPYHGLLKSMDWFQLIIFVASIFFALLIIICFILLKHLLISPIDIFVSTMTHIKEGQIDSRLRMPEYISEFSQLSSVFNGMMDEITELRIEKYEQQVELQQVELQRLQIQIRPHFYLNCLKMFYGMAEQRQYKKIQDMILSLSDYLRSLFNNRDFTVPIRDELASVKKFVLLQQKSENNPPSFTASVTDSVENFKIPSMSILTFVENSIKYARIPDVALKIKVTAKLLESTEDTLGDENPGNSFVNITIADNGPGFPEDSLEKLNSKNPVCERTEQVGIMNIRRRLAIMYGDKFELIFFNRHGACIELFIPYDLPPRNLSVSEK